MCALNLRYIRTQIPAQRRPLQRLAKTVTLFSITNFSLAVTKETQIGSGPRVQFLADTACAPATA